MTITLEIPLGIAGLSPLVDIYPDGADAAPLLSGVAATAGSNDTTDYYATVTGAGSGLVKVVVRIGASGFLARGFANFPVSGQETLRGDRASALSVGTEQGQVSINGGFVGFDLNNIGNPNTTLTLPNLTIGASRASNQLDFGTAVGGSSTTIVLPINSTLVSQSGAADGNAVGCTLWTTGSPGVGQTATITAFVLSTRTATFSPAMNPAPGTGTIYRIIADVASSGGNAPTVAQIAAGVRDVNNQTPASNSLGAAVNAAGAGDVTIQNNIVIPPAVSQASQTLGRITAVRGDTLSATLTLGTITGWSKVYWTAKQKGSDADSAAILQVETIAAGGGGLLILLGETAPDPTKGSLTVTDTINGYVTLMIAASVMAQLCQPNLYWDCEVIYGSGAVSTPQGGIFAVVIDITQATT